MSNSMTNSIYVLDNYLEYKIICCVIIFRINIYKYI